MKKRVMIIGLPMASGGIPAALISMLQHFDYDRYDVTLLLDDLTGEWTNRIPQEVRVKEFRLKRKYPFAWIVWANPFKGKVSKKLFQVYRKIIRKAIKICRIPQEKISDYVIRRYTLPEEEYDAVLHYRGDRKFMAEYATKGIKAGKYATWVHGERIRMISIQDRSDMHFDIGAYDKIFCVSASLKAVVDEAYPELADRTEVCYNQVNIEEILEKAKEPAKDERFTGDYKIVTVGRIALEKGYNIAVDAAKVLKDRGLSFKWFFVGDGLEAKNIRAKIEQLGLQKEVIMLGTKPNPMPYVAAADLFVQPSLSEGYGLSLLEARILQKPIVCTELPVFKEQIVHEKNGLLAPISGEGLAGQISRIMADKTLADSLVDNLRKEPVDFTSEMDKIYDFIG